MKLSQKASEIINKLNCFTPCFCVTDCEEFDKLKKEYTEKDEDEKDEDEQTFFEGLLMQLLKL